MTSRNQTRRKSLPTRSVGGGVQILGGAMFCLAGLAIFLGLFGRPIMLTLESRNWVEVSAIVDSAAVESHGGSDGTTYSISARYHYSYSGGSYSGNRYEFVGGGTAGLKGKQKVVDALRPGSAVTCYVDPRDPASSVLNRYSFTLLFGLLPLLFVAAGLVAVRSGVQARAKVALIQDRGLRPGWLPAPNHRVEGGQVILAPQKTRFRNFAFLLFFMLFWNGILSGIIGDGVTLFMIPFVLVGFLLIALTVHQFLSILNPVIELTLNSAGASPGERLNLSWNIRGAVGRLKRLKIRLVGTESATYRRGKNTVTDRNEFKNVLVFESEMVGPMGAATISIPSDAMHSFEAASNAITWRLKVEGEVPRWPDVNDDYELVVIPKGMKNG